MAEAKKPVTRRNLSKVHPKDPIEKVPRIRVELKEDNYRFIKIMSWWYGLSISEYTEGLIEAMRRTALKEDYEYVLRQFEKVEQEQIEKEVKQRKSKEVH